MKSTFYKLMLLTCKHEQSIEAYLSFLTICATHGITSVQLREKNIPFTELLAFGKRLQNILTPLAIPLIVNDSIELAFALDAAGVHLGQTDGDVMAARKLLGPKKYVGLTVCSLEQLEVANYLPIDYVGVGTVFPTQNKANITRLLGCNGLKQLSALSKHPVVAIGGINESNVQEVINAGAQGVAAIGAFHEAHDPGKTVRVLRAEID